MKFNLNIAVSIAFSIFAITNTSISHAAPKLESVKQCIRDKTTSKDKKDFAKWIFITMSAHPEIQDFSLVTSDSKNKSDQIMANLIQSLFINKCRGEIQELITEFGASSTELVYEFIGELAMDEILTNPKVIENLQGFSKYIDKEKFEKLFKKK